MSGQEAHLHVPCGLFTPQQLIPTLPTNTDQFIDQILASPPLHHPGMELGDNNAIFPPATAQPPPRMEFTQETFLQLQALAQTQAKQIEDGNAFQNQAAIQLQDSQRQLEATQKSLADLTAAFNSLSTQGRPLTVTSAPKKKPELPPFDSKNVLIWIRRIEAAYSRAGVIDPKDKFAWMESIFQVKLDPQIDAYLYGNNTAQDWVDFLDYLKQQYGPTIRQKTQKLMGDIQRHDLKPSQFLLQIKEDCKDVEIDHILREHVLKTIPPRIREILGKEVEDMSAEDVAKAADSFFDRNGRPVEKSTAPINLVTSASSSRPTPTPSSIPAASAAFTSAYSDDDDSDVNHVRRGGFRGADRGRSNNRGQRSRSRPNFNRAPNASSTGSASTSSSSTSSSAFPPGTCRWHRRFGDKSLKCVTDCPRFKSFSATQKPGNGQGGRRM